MASPSLLEAIKSWFASLENDWTVSETLVDDEGVHAADSSIRLRQVRMPRHFMLAITDASHAFAKVDITPHEARELAEAIAKLARARETDANFDKCGPCSCHIIWHPYLVASLLRSFIAWCAENGPFDTIVDGANVGMYNQSLSGEFEFRQVEKLMAQLRDERGPDAHPVLLVLHKRRLRRTPATVHFIRQWEMSSARPFTCSLLHAAHLH